MDRRSFLRAAGMAIGASLLARGALAQQQQQQQREGARARTRRVSRGDTQPQRQLQTIGLQLYTLRSVLPRNVKGTLAEVARIGYKEVELAGLAGKTPREFRAILDSVGLTAPSSHIDLAQIRRDLQRVLDDAQALGNRFVVVPSLPDKERTADGYKRVAVELSRAGERAKRSGIQLAYHNHNMEFQPIAAGGKSGWDILLAESDADAVKLELDLYWATKAGHDPVALFARAPGRFPLVHVKDMTKNGSFADVGAGTIDFARIFARADEAGIKHWFVEHDEPVSPLETARASYNYLRDLRF